jgi:hypothetical protein
MKNRSLELGSSIRLPKVVKPAPPEFADWLNQAAIDGDRFTPNLVEMHPRKYYRALQERMEYYQGLCRQNTAVSNAVVASFHYSLSRIILENPHEEKYLINQALISSVEAQNRLVCALLGLLGDDRKTIYRTEDRTGFGSMGWKGFFQGSMAVARFVQASLRCGVSTRFARAYHDLKRKIDLFCEPPFEGSPTLCVQVKSKSKSRGCKISMLASEKDVWELPPDELSVGLGVWKGVLDFNEEYNRSWTPCIATVGFLGPSITQVFDEQLEKDVVAFFKGLVIGRKGENAHPFDYSLYA